MNIAAFTDHVNHTVFAGKINGLQRDGLGKILAYRLSDHPDLLDNQFAYVLATATWESGHTLQPIRERGSEAYLRRKPYYPYVGEGLVQVTWEANYLKFGAHHPGDLLQWPIALRALFDGMIKGMFTGKKLADFINAAHCDFIHARQIVNGMDRAAIVASLANSYLAAIRAS